MIYTVIIQTKSVTNGSHCDNCSPQEYTRIKRAKYYGPQKFYRRPPTNYPTKGAFSYTPPPGYMDDEDKHPSFRPKVSKKRTTDGLGDEDINNLVKYLTKKDLDKIIEFAGEKGKYSDREHEMEYRQTYKRPEYNGQDEDGEKFLNGPYINEQKNTQRYALRDHPNVQHQGNPNLNYINDATQPRILNSNPQDVLNPGPVVYQNEAPNPRIIYSNPPGIPPLQTPGQISFLNQNAEGSIFTDSSVMKEETLPKPSNLRDDYEISYTNNVEKVVKSESSSYKVEDFGELPLMNYYDSKLHSVSSYNVPHYTVSIIYNWIHNKTLL